MKTLTEKQLEAEFVTEHNSAWDTFKSLAKPFTARQEVGPVKYICVEDLGDGLGLFEPIGGGERIEWPLKDFHPG